MNSVLNNLRDLCIKPFMRMIFYFFNIVQKDYVIYIMNTLITTITTDILLKSITSITTSIISTHTTYTWFMEHKNNNYEIYKKKISSHDLNINLLIVHSLIKDILFKYCSINDIDKNEYIDKLISNEHDTIIIENYDDVQVVSHQYDSNFNTIPNPLKLSLYGTINIINTLNNNLNNLYKNINNHSNSYCKYFITLDLEKDINIIYDNILIFEKRFDILLKLLHCYDIKKI